MMNLLKKIWRNPRGNVIVIMGATLPLVIGCAGLATDTIQWTLWKRQLQRAADSAALAGVYTRTATDNLTAVEASVCNDLAKNQRTGLQLAGTYFSCPDGSTRRGNVSMLGDSGTMTRRVLVSLTVSQSLPFSSMFMTAVPQITANATAASVPGGGDPCIEARTMSSSEIGLKFTGNSDVFSPDCPGFSNASSANTSVATGSARVTLDWIGGVGGIQQTTRFTVNAYRPYSPPLADRFLGVTPNPAAMNCNPVVITGSGGGNGSGSTNNSSTTVLSDTTTFPAKDSAGNVVNCFSSLSVGSNRSLTLPSNGTYYINGGDAFIQGNLTCVKCTIVLTNQSTSLTATIGGFKVNADAKVNISAPDTGTFKGLAIYQDRRAVDSNANVNKINGNSTSMITGAIYFPNQELQYNGTGTTAAICTLFVAKRIDFSGNSSTSNKFKKLTECAAVGLGDSGLTRIVRLVA